MKKQFKEVQMKAGDIKEIQGDFKVAAMIMEALEGLTGLHFRS